MIDTTVKAQLSDLSQAAPDRNRPKRNTHHRRAAYAESLEDIGLVDIAGADSFPASDPPCWTLGRDPDQV